MSATELQAGLARRLFATVIDAVVVAIVAIVLTYALGVFEHHSAYTPTQIIFRIFLLTSGSYLLVNSWLLHKSGQTLGKRLFGICMVSADDGSALPFWKLLLRPLAQFVCLAIGTIGYLVILVDWLFAFSASRRCLHDRLVGSKVERLIS